MDPSKNNDLAGSVITKKQSVLLKTFISEPIQQWLSEPLDLASKEYAECLAATEQASLFLHCERCLEALAF
jgi:hypothetical protein